MTKSKNRLQKVLAWYKANLLQTLGLAVLAFVLGFKGLGLANVLILLVIVFGVHFAVLLSLPDKNFEKYFKVVYGFDKNANRLVWLFSLWILLLGTLIMTLIAIMGVVIGDMKPIPAVLLFALYVGIITYCVKSLKGLHSTK